LASHSSDFAATSVISAIRMESSPLIGRTT
jgi:hypothetical protein